MYIRTYYKPVVTLYFQCLWFHPCSYDFCWFCDSELLISATFSERKTSVMIYSPKGVNPVEITNLYHLLTITVVRFYHSSIREFREKHVASINSFQRECLEFSGLKTSRSDECSLLGWVLHHLFFFSASPRFMYEKAGTPGHGVWTFGTFGRFDWSRHRANVEHRPKA